MIAFKNHRLVGKFATLFVVAALGVALASFFALQQILAPTFASIEQRANQEQVARTRNALREIDSHLQAFALDYAVWDEMYRFARSPDRAFQDGVFTPLGYENAGVDYMAVIRFDGTVVWSQADNEEGTAFLASESAVLTPLMVSGRFADMANNRENAGAYVRGTRGLYVMQSTWIRKTDGSGPIFARLITGKLLNEQTLSNALQVRARLDLAVSPERRRALATSPDAALSEVGSDRISNILGLSGPAGEILATVSFSTPRTISKTGAGAINSAIAAMGVSLVGLAVLLALGVHRIAVLRLQKLRDHVASFRTGRRVIDPRLLASDDEIGGLAKQFDRLADELAEAENELRRSSYVQGKADSAVGLLHNVRNALVPLQIKYDKWEREDRLPLRNQLIQAIDELAGDACNAERRAALEMFVAKASRKLVETGSIRSAEIVDIKHSVDQIMAILADYDFDSSATPCIEPVDVESLLRREIANLESMTGTPVALVMQDAVPPVLANHIHLNQVIANLLINAAEAMKTRGPDEWVLTVSAAIDEAAGSVEIAITDNGEGADAAVLARAFERGFSTRKDKSGGMGLHWSSNTVRAMNGELRLESPGPGRGATARLRLPLASGSVIAMAA